MKIKNEKKKKMYNKYRKNNKKDNKVKKIIENLLLLQYWRITHAMHTPCFVH